MGIPHGLSSARPIPPAAFGVHRALPSSAETTRVAAAQRAVAVDEGDEGR